MQDASEETRVLTWWIFKTWCSVTVILKHTAVVHWAMYSSPLCSFFTLSISGFTLLHLSNCWVTLCPFVSPEISVTSLPLSCSCLWLRLTQSTIEKCVCVSAMWRSVPGGWKKSVMSRLLHAYKLYQHWVSLKWETEMSGENASVVKCLNYLCTLHCLCLESVLLSSPVILAEVFQWF